MSIHRLKVLRELDINTSFIFSGKESQEYILKSVTRKIHSYGNTDKKGKEVLIMEYRNKDTNTVGTWKTIIDGEDYMNEAWVEVITDEV